MERRSCRKAIDGCTEEQRKTLKQRVALLKGLPESALERVYEERLRLSPGAETLLAARRIGLE